jgi:hypothetical protein
VQRGADALALARSIVLVATPTAPIDTCALLGGHGIGAVRLRVRLLLGYAERPPERLRARPVGLAALLLGLLMAAPHVVGAAPLDALHFGVERAFFEPG